MVLAVSGYQQGQTDQMVRDRGVAAQQHRGAEATVDAWKRHCAGLEARLRQAQDERYVAVVQRNIYATQLDGTQKELARAAPGNPLANPELATRARIGEVDQWAAGQGLVIDRSGPGEPVVRRVR